MTILNVGKIIVPTHDNDGTPLTEVRDYIARGMCKAFGGVTETTGKGRWVDNDGNMFIEPVTILETACPVSEASNLKLFYLGMHLLDVTQQKAVYVQYPNQCVEIINR